MRSSSISASAMFHVAVIIIATFSLPWLKRDLEIPPPISVEFVEISKVTETNKVAQPKPKKEEKKPEEKPPPAAKNTSSEPVAPVKKEIKKEEKELKKEDTVLVDKMAPPEKKKTPDEEKKKEVTKKEEPKKDFSSVLKNLQVTEDKPPVKADTEDLNLDEAAAMEGQVAPLGTKLSMSEEDALRRQLEGCWSVPYGAKDAENLRVEIFMVINPDRTLREARVVDNSRYGSDSFFRAAADSALRAVRNPLCSPFEVPPDKYDVWKTVTVTFDPSQMF